MSHAQNCDVQPSGPVNGSAFNRYLTLSMIAILKRIRPFRGTVLMLTDRICVKYGQHMDLTEAAAMHFISQNTSIPVPKSLCAFTHGDMSYIVMERIKGVVLGMGWVKRSKESKNKLTQLKNMVLEIRELRPPKDIVISSVTGGPLYDGRVPGTSLRFGPFASIPSFHRHLRSGTDFDPKFDSEENDLIRQHGRDDWPMVFSHGDLSSLNILVRGDNIVGIIDWETAG